MPKEAFLTPETAEQLLLQPLQTSAGPVPRVVALSYRWLSPEHPDPDGYQLGRLLTFLRAHLGCFFGEAAAKWTPGTSVPPRDQLDVGVMWDFMSLAQAPRIGNEQNRFDRGFSAINKVYGSAGSTITVQLTDTPPGVKGYQTSGWCRFEEAVSGIIKSPSFLRDMSEWNSSRERATHPTRHTPGSCRFKEAVSGIIKRCCFLRDTSEPPKTFFSELDPNAVRDLAFAEAMGFEAMGFRLRGSLQDFLVFTSNHAAGRKPVLHPDDMEVILKSEAVTFTNGSDVDTVIEKYRSFFKSVAGKGYCFELRGADGGRGGRRGRDIQEGEDGALVLRRNAHVQQVSDRISPMPQDYARGTRTHGENALILADALVVLPALQEVDFQWSKNRWTSSFCEDAEVVLQKKLKSKPELKVSFPQRHTIPAEALIVAAR